MWRFTPNHSKLKFQISIVRDRLRRFFHFATESYSDRSRYHVDSRTECSTWAVALLSMPRLRRPTQQDTQPSFIGAFLSSGSSCTFQAASSMRDAAIGTRHPSILRAVLIESDLFKNFVSPALTLSHGQSQLQRQLCNRPFFCAIYMLFDNDAMYTTRPQPMRDGGDITHHDGLLEILLPSLQGFPAHRQVRE